MLLRCLYSGLVGELPFVARVALLAFIGELAFVVCAFCGFLLPYASYVTYTHAPPPLFHVTYPPEQALSKMPCSYAFLTIASLCNTSESCFFVCAWRMRADRFTSLCHNPRQH